MTAWSTHPVPVARAAAAARCGSTPARTAGSSAANIPRRDDDGNASVSEEIKAAAASYREEFSRTQDPLVGLLRRLGDGASDLGEWAGGGAARAASTGPTRPARRHGRPGAQRRPSDPGTNGS